LDVLYSLNKFFIHPHSAHFFLTNIGSHGRAQLKRVRLHLREGALSQPAWTLLAQCSNLELLEINLKNSDAVSGVSGSIIRGATKGSKEKRKRAKVAVLMAQDWWARSQIQHIAPIAHLRKLPQVTLRWYWWNKPPELLFRSEYTAPLHELERIDIWTTGALLQESIYVRTTEEDVSSVSSLSDSGDESSPDDDDDPDTY